MPGKRGGLSPVIRSQAPKGGEASDAVSALIVALDMMFKRTTKDKATDVDHAPRSMTLTTGHAYLPPCFRWQDSSLKYNRHIKLITDERLSVVGCDGHLQAGGQAFTKNANGSFPHAHPRLLP